MDQKNKYHPIMPEVGMSHAKKNTTKTAVIGRSPSGHPVVSFDSPEKARTWLNGHSNHRIKFYLQTITEEEIEINI